MIVAVSQNATGCSPGPDASAAVRGTDCDQARRQRRSINAIAVRDKQMTAAETETPESVARCILHVERHANGGRAGLRSTWDLIFAEFGDFDDLALSVVPGDMVEIAEEVSTEHEVPSRAETRLHAIYVTDAGDAGWFRYVHGSGINVDSAQSLRRAMRVLVPTLAPWHPGTLVKGSLKAVSREALPPQLREDLPAVVTMTPFMIEPSWRIKEIDDWVAEHRGEPILGEITTSPYDNNDGLVGGFGDHLLSDGGNSFGLLALSEAKIVDLGVKFVRWAFERFAEQLEHPPDGYPWGRTRYDALSDSDALSVHLESGGLSFVPPALNIH